MTTNVDMSVGSALEAAELFSVRDRVAVVTGASSGLGYRFAQVLAANGARVLAVARRAERLAGLAETMPGIEPFPADLRDPTAAEGILEAVLDRFGPLDILVNNAGVGVARPALEEGVDRLREVLEVNVTSLFDLSCRAATRMMESGGGSIINIASMLGLVASMPVPNATYAASKGAVVNLTRELACQWARSSVRVNAIAPGWFPSEMTEGLPPDFVRRSCPMGRMGRVEELDGALLFLASDASSYCVGHILTVDGGWTAH